jgi:hypothetical protein
MNVTQATSHKWTDPERAELANLFHLARTALIGYQPTRYTRKLWAAKEFHKVHPEVCENGAYKELCRQEAWRQ